MKLYVWEGDDVLSDYTSGMIVALAPDLETALKCIRKNCDYCMSSFPNDKPSKVINLDDAPNPEVWLVWEEDK